jgi:hypothetical protein
LEELRVGDQSAHWRTEVCFFFLGRTRIHANQKNSRGRALVDPSSDTRSTIFESWAVILT